MTMPAPADRLILRRIIMVFLVVAAYGLMVYAIIWAVPDSDREMALISGAFLLAMGIGSLSTVVADPRAERSLSRNLGIALWSLLALCLLLLLPGIEGIVCILMALPIMLPGIMLGVVVAWFSTRWWQNRGTTLTVIALPLLIFPLEAQVSWPDYQGHVSTEIAIAAPPETVWANTVEIRDIDPDKLRFTISHDLMFFPRPLDARLDHHGPGATRALKWTSGVHFRELITDWQPNRRLGWTFAFDADSIPAEIDRRLRPDGEASELLRGEYVLEPDGKGGTILRLTTHYKVSLPWNGYGRLWADRLLSDFHVSVLDVIKTRSEGGSMAVARAY